MDYLLRPFLLYDLEHIPAKETAEGPSKIERHSQPDGAYKPQRAGSSKVAAVCENAIKRTAIELDQMKRQVTKSPGKGPPEGKCT